MMVVQSEQLLHQHELVHAVHFETWPVSRAFLHEGLAVMLDGASMISEPWPPGTSLEPLLAAERSSDLDYFQAWFIVSQIVRDHGMDGLRELWHAVPRDASATQVRQTYEDLFDRPMTALLEPEVVFPGEPFEMTVPRHPCYLTVCVGELEPWDGDRWSGEAADGCEDDPLAVGPSDGNFAGPVWRQHLVELGPTDHIASSSDGVGAMVRPCGVLRCGADEVPYTVVSPDNPSVELGPYWSGMVRMEVGRDLEALPAAELGFLELERLGP
ncbi:MAG: hypothetical protein AB1Z98_05605 [Nannocystaceae bacterium]